MDAIQVLRERRSVRVYDKNRAVRRDDIETIIDCGRLAATARNIQPWEFIVITDAEKRRELAGLASHGKHIADAPVCIAVLCKDGDYYLEDGCAATQNILVAAWALGLGSCWIAGDKKPYAPAIAAAVGAPEGLRLISLISLGYPEIVPSPAKRSLAEVLHWEQY